MKAPHKLIQWAIVTALFSVGLLALLVIAGNDDPANPLPLGEWLLIKVIAAAIAYACYRFGRYLYRLGLLPVMDYDFKEEDYYE